MTRKNIPKPPASLAATGRQLWRDLHRAFTFDDPASIEHVRRYCEAGDVAAAAKEILERDGPISADRYGRPSRHPAAVVFRDSVTMQAQLAKLLGLYETSTGPGRKMGT